MAIIDSSLLHGIHLTRMRHAGVLRPDHGEDAVFQTSTIDALLDGAYEGDVTFGELARHGDFGIGTLQGLDGEMVALDGEFFVARTDGRVSPVPAEMKTPFAAIVRWKSDRTCPIGPAASLRELLDQLDRCGESATNILALRVDGQFTRMQVRSVAKQSPPYPPLADVTKGQTVFEWSHLHGTLIGFRFPDPARGYEMVGYHFHFLSSDRQHGGHVLDCALPAGTAQFHRSQDLQVEIPKGLAWHPPASGEAQAAALKRIEGRPLTTD